MVTPRLDAVEEVTVTGATPGTTGGTGAVQIAFVTRSGSNNFDSSIYHYFRHPSLNTNYFFNEIDGLDKNNVKVHQYGGRVGDQIVIPGLFNGRNKAFFFFNFEHEHRPSEATRTRTILNEQAMQGLFTYTVGGVPRQINLLQLAAANGQTSTLDPTIANLLTRSAPLRVSPALSPPTGCDQHAGLQVPERLEERPVPPDDAHRRQRNRRAPSDRHVLLAALPQQARPAEQRRPVVSWFPKPGR